MSTLAVMKARIASEFRRDDLTADIANAIATAIDAYKYERFPFNRETFVEAPTTDDATGNAWMTTAERLIRSRAKFEVAVNVIEYPADSTVVTQLTQEIQDALQQLRLSQTTSASNVDVVRNSLGAMKVRIANEIGRGDLGPEIENAIFDAIDQYQHVRFYFNESRNTLIDLAQGQADYTADDNVEIGNILKLDYVVCRVGGLTYTVDPAYPERIELAMTNGTMQGIPSDYCFYNETLRLYPVPNDAYQIRLAYTRKLPAPETDDETGNRWMLDAEKLIRSRAKAELYVHVQAIANTDEAAKFNTLAESYLERLNQETNRKAQVGAALVAPYDV